MQSKLAHVSSEGSGTVMVLAVYIIGDGSADGDESRARSDRKKPAFGQKYVNDVRESDAAFAAQHARRFIETENAIQAPAVDKCSAGIETGVAVAATKTVGKQGAGRCGMRESPAPGRSTPVYGRAGA